jgi:hypothetical protein
MGAMVIDLRNGKFEVRNLGNKITVVEGTAEEAMRVAEVLCRMET